MLNLHAAACWHFAEQLTDYMESIRLRREEDLDEISQAQAKLAETAQERDRATLLATADRKKFATLEASRSLAVLRCSRCARRKLGTPAPWRRLYLAADDAA